MNSGRNLSTTENGTRMAFRPRSESIALWCALFLTFCICVIKAGAPQWVALAWVSLSTICYGMLVMSNVIRNKPPIHTALPENRFQILRDPVVLLAFFQCWAIIQHFFVSHDQANSGEQVLIGLGMLCLIGVWSVGIRAPKALESLYLTIITFATIQAFYGIWVYLSASNTILWMPKLHYLDRPTGFFVNANHFAAYIVLASILILSRILSDSSKTSNRNFLFTVLDSAYSPRNVVLLFLIATLILSKSVGALVSLAAVLMIVMLKGFFDSARKKEFFFLFVIIVFAFVLALLTVDYSLVEGLTKDLAHTINRRIALSIASLSMLETHWLWGTGGGGFYSSFSAFRTIEIGNAYYNHAHNDIIQFWVEYGLIGAILLVLFISSTIRNNLQVLSISKTGIHATFSYAGIYTTIAILIHSLVDFPLRIPGFSVCYLVIILINSLELHRR